MVLSLYPTYSFGFSSMYRINKLFDGGDSAGVDGLLEVILLPEGLLILLEFEEFAPFRIFDD